MPHVVELCSGGTPSLTGRARGFLHAGLEVHDALVVIADERRRANLLECLNDRELPEAQLLVLDSRQTLGRFMVNGAPEWELFNGFVGEAMRDQAATGRSLRAFGDMVDVLCKDGRYDAAIELEAFWNRLRGGVDFDLYCVYQADSLPPKANEVSALLCAHDVQLPLITS